MHIRSRSAIYSLVVLLFSSNVWSQEATTQTRSKKLKEPTQSLTEQARSEILQPGKIKTESTDVKISSSMLSLADSRPQLEARHWQYVLGFSVQQFAPSGTGSNDLTTTKFDLSDSGSTVLPEVTFGVRAPLVAQPNWTMQWGLDGRLAYTSQRTRAEFNTGFVEGNVRLNSMMYSVDPKLSLKWRRLSWLALNLGYEWGVVSYTQTSANEQANFSRHGNYSGVLAGFDFFIKPNWITFVEYTQRNLSSSSEISLQANNYKLGMRVLW